MKPLTSERNLTPNATATVSGSVGFAGVAVGAQILLPTQLPLPVPTVTVTPAPGVSRFPLSSTDRLLRGTDPDPLGVQLYVQGARPLAGCQVAPPAAAHPPPGGGRAPDRDQFPRCHIRAGRRRGDGRAGGRRIA